MFLLVGYGAGYMGNHPILNTSDFIAVYQVYVGEIMFEGASYVAYMSMCRSCDWQLAILDNTYI